jgi:alcohol dehydrogenase class IV
VKFTQSSAVPAFARVARLLNPALEKESDTVAAEKCEEEMRQFLITLGISKKLSDCGMPESEIEALAKQCMVLPDYKGNPRVATAEEMVELVKESWN